jgi:hypothetical protein
MEDVLVPIALFAIIPFIIWAVSHYRYKAKVQSSEIIKAMVGKDVVVTPDVVKAVGFTPKRTHTDLRNGMILVAIGLAMIIFGGAVPEDEAQVIFAGMAMFPILIGASLLIFWYAVSRKDNA